MKNLTWLPLAVVLCACGANPPDLALVNDPVPGEEETGGAAGAAGAGSAGGGAAGAAAGAGASAGAGAAGECSGGSSAGSSGNCGSAGGPGAACDGSKAEGLPIASIDLYRYPSYAVDGCQLAYLAPTSGGAELRLRDLATGAEQVLAPESEKPIRPSIGWPVVAWEATVGSEQAVRVWKDGLAVTVTGSFARATEPRAASDAVALTVWKDAAPDADTDVALYTVATGVLDVVFEGPSQQRFADVSATHVAFTDFSEDPDGVFGNDGADLADVVLFDRATGALEAHKLPGKQAFPMLGSPSAVVYLEWPGEHPEPKFQAYGVRAWDLASAGLDRALGDVLTGAGDYARPSSRAGLVEWVMYPEGKSALYRASLQDASPAASLAGFEGKQVYAPVSAGSFSLVAVRPEADPGAAPTLTVLKH
jgi:hypothetical protein